MVCVSVKAETASFYYTVKGGKRILLAGNEDVTKLSTRKAKGFVGSVEGMYAISIGLQCNKSEMFNFMSLLFNNKK